MFFCCSKTPTSFVSFIRHFCKRGCCETIMLHCTAVRRCQHGREIRCRFVFLNHNTRSNWRAMAAVWHVDLQLVVLAGQESAWENNRLQSYLAAAEKGSESETHDMSLKVLISLDILRLTGCNKHTKKKQTELCHSRNEKQGPEHRNISSWSGRLDEIRLMWNVP